ncbi:MAG: Fic family protein [Pseudomonadota bacterium]
MLKPTSITEARYRSGRYVSQTTGYKSFIPNILPPEPPIAVDDARLNEALSRADRALGRLDGSISTLPDPSLFLSMFARKEAVISSQIEGTQASLSDLVMTEANIFNKARPTDVNEVRNYMRAIRVGEEMLNELPVSTRMIKALHRTLMHGVRGQHQTPGEIRTSQNWIGAPGCTLSEAAFVPPPAHEVMQCLSDLEHFIHNIDDHIPVLIKAGLIHGQFETIHPFLDGNGRVGRLLITLFLLEQEILTAPVLYLSYYFRKNQTEYYAKLQAIRDTGDWEGWLTFFLNGVAEVSNLAAKTARELLLLREENRQMVLGEFSRSATMPLRMLDHLYSSPVTNLRLVATKLGVSAPTANNIIAGLEKCGILREVTGQKRHRVFIHHEYMRKFDGL